jgi:hypothetical protein
VSGEWAVALAAVLVVALLIAMGGALDQARRTGPAPAGWRVVLVSRVVVAVHLTFAAATAVLAVSAGRRGQYGAALVMLLAGAFLAWRAVSALRRWRPPPP